MFERREETFQFHLDGMNNVCVVVVINLWHLQVASARLTGQDVTDEMRKRPAAACFTQEEPETFKSRAETERSHDRWPVPRSRTSVA